MPELPPIKLDITLAELYQIGCPDGTPKRIGLVSAAINSEMDLNPNMPRNTKYIYVDSTFFNITDHPASSEYKVTQRQSAVKYLSLISQHDAFVAGNMNVIIFNTEEADEWTAHSLKEAEHTIGQLDASQRPHLRFIHSPQDVSLEEYGIDLLATKLVLDGLEGYPTTIDLDTHYYLNSKLALATSGLPTPRCTIIELEDLCPDAESCCTSCADCEDSMLIPSGCNGARAKWLSSWVARMTQVVKTHPLPFVFKNNQAFGGGGTIVVPTEEERDQLIHDLSIRILPKLLPLVHSSNSHLKPATLLLSDMVREPIGDYGLTFFLTQTGECRFISVSEQTLDSNKAWIGSTISYSAQDALKQKFNNVMHDIGTWLHRYGYYGPIGADILETAPGEGSQDTETFHIVDLNVRTSGSLALGFLSRHFAGERGLNEACQFSINARMGRNEFIEKMGRRYTERRMVIDSWYEDKKSGVSYAKIVIGAEDKQRLQREIESVKEYAEEVKW